MRDDAWLFSRLDDIWDKHFNDVYQDNDVLIKFGRKARQRMGSIKKDKDGNSIITINGLFRKKFVPQYVVDVTIAHELCHYAHGFNSPHMQKFRHPHQGGVVNKELKERGMGEELKKQKKWFKDNWEGIVKKNFKPSKRRKRRVIIKWI